MTTLLETTTATNTSATEGDVKTFLGNIREFIAGFLGTDTAAKGAALQSLGSPLNATSVKSATFTATAADRGKVFACSGTFTVNCVAAATLGDGFSFGLWNAGSGLITFDPNLAETVDGKTTRIIRAGKMVMIYCDGSKFVTVGASELEEFASGADGLPRIRAEAFATVSDLPVISVSAASTYVLDIGITQTAGSSNTASSSYVVASTIQIDKYSGSVKVDSGHYATGSFGTPTSYLSIYKNGELVQTWTTASATTVSRTVNVDVSSGDVLEARHRVSGTAATSTVSSFSVSADNAYTIKGAIGKAVV